MPVRQAPRWQAPASFRVALPAPKQLPINIDPNGSRVVLDVHRDIWG
jgi:hypothetical protein